METHTKIFVQMKNYRRCSYNIFAIGYFRSFAVLAIDIGYFCSHVGVGVSDTLADRSGQQYFCIVIVIGYSHSCDTIDIGEFGSYGVRAFIAYGRVRLARLPRIVGQGIRHISRLIQLLFSFEAINIGYFIHVDKSFEELSTTTDVLIGL